MNEINAYVVVAFIPNKSLLLQILFSLSDISALERVIQNTG